MIFTAEDSDIVASDSEALPVAVREGHHASRDFDLLTKVVALSYHPRYNSCSEVRGAITA